MRPSFDEMQATSTTVREHYRGYDRWLAQQPRDVMKSRREEAEMIFRRVGITSAVYGAKDEDGSGTERQKGAVSAPTYRYEWRARRFWNSRLVELEPRIEPIISSAA